MSNPSGQLAIKDIASLAGMTRAAVSNWRSRNEDFPSPVEGSSQKRPLFDLHEILAWLKEQNRLPLDAQKKQTEIGIWGVTNLLSGVLSTPVDVTVLVLYLLAMRKSAEEKTGDSAWETIVSATTVTDLVQALVEAEAPRDIPHVSDLDVLDRIGGSLNDHMVSDLVTSVNSILIEDYGEAAGIVIDRVLGIGGRGDLSALGTSKSPQSMLLINAAATTLGGGHTVFDPACGIGGTLLGVHEKQDQITVVGNDVERSPVAIAQLHAFLRDVPAVFTCSDSLKSDIHADLLAHTVVIEPPFGMNIDLKTQQRILNTAGVEASGSLMSDELFICAALSNLSQGGYAYVLTSIGAGSRPPSKQIRQELIARGLVEAVIQLPPKFLPYTGIATLLWVLHRPEDNVGTSVMIADATDVSAPEENIAQWLSDIRAGQGSTIPSRRLTLAELITNDGVINPSIQLSPQIDSRDVWQGLEHSLSAVHTGLTEIHNVDIDVDELVQNIPVSRGFMELSQMIARKDIIRTRGTYSLLRVKPQPNGIEAFLLQQDKDAGPNTAIMVSKNDVWVQDGDILVPDYALAPARVFVADDSAWVVPTGMLVLRINDPALDAHYLAACINAPFNKSAVKKSTHPRRDMMRIQVPVLNPIQQQQLVVAVGKLTEVQKKVDRLSQQVSEATDAALNAVRYGTE